jgi:LVIVD repeat-containing protein
MNGRSSARTRVLAWSASVALSVTAILVVTSGPGVGSPGRPPDLGAHRRRYEQAIESRFRNAPERFKLAAQQRLQKALQGTRQPAWNLSPQGLTPCVNGHAGQWPCKNLDLLSYMPMSALGGGNSNDVWGWTDSLTGKEYAILGRSNGTAFVDISDPTNPVYVGNLPSWQGYQSSWRAIKVYQNYAYVVADAIPHGMQVFDLTRLRDVPSPPVTFTSDYHYSRRPATCTRWGPTRATAGST